MRNGTQPVPRRTRIFPPMPTEKVRVRKTDSLISGEGCRRAWRMYSPSRAMPLMSSTEGEIGADPVAEDFKAAGKGNEAQAEQEKSPSSRRGGAEP